MPKQLAAPLDQLRIGFGIHAKAFGYVGTIGALMVRRRFFSAVSNHEMCSPSFETRPRGRSSG
jgi:hypothetical protein